MKPDFSPPPPYGSSRLPTFTGWCAALGPGIVWMALAQGSGELIWWPYLCAKYGLGFLFLLTPACLLQYSVTFEIGRYTALTGESIWRGFVRLHPVFGFFLWILMVLSFLWFGAFASAGGTALAQLFSWPPLDERGRSLFWGSLSIFVFAFALLTQKRTYWMIEKIMWGVSILTLFGLAVSCARPELRSHWPAFLKAIVVPGGLARPWDPADADRLLTAITFAGLGGFWTLFYSYWILGKGIAGDPSRSGCVPREAEGSPQSSLESDGKAWRRFLFVDAGIGIFGNLLTTYMACFLAYAILFPQGIVPADWRLAAEQSRFFEVSWGTFGKGLFLVVAAAFMCDTWLSTADAVARVHLEMIRFYFFRTARVNEVLWYRVLIVVLTAVTGVTMFFKQPGQLIVLSALIGFVGTVIFTVALIVLIHGRLRPALPGPLKPGNLSFGFLTLSALAYALLAAAYLKIKFF